MVVCVQHMKGSRQSSTKKGHTVKHTRLKGNMGESQFLLLLINMTTVLVEITLQQIFNVIAMFLWIFFFFCGGSLIQDSAGKIRRLYSQ